MKTRLFTFPVWAALLWLLIACAPAYVPNTVHTPMLSQKNEFHASVHGGLSGFDPQLAFAPAENIGVMVNGSFADNTTDTTDNYHKHTFVEAGVGYFTPVGTKGRFELYGGYGAGVLEAMYENKLWSDQEKINSNRVFLQPAFGMTSNYFDASLASRLAYVKLYSRGESAAGVFVEPVLTTKFGYKFLKGIAQIGLSMPLNKAQVDFDYQPFMFSLGLQATIGRQWE